MKKVNILLFILTLLSLLTYGQDYYPIVEDDKIWNVLSVIYIPSDPYYDTTFLTVSYKILGDTVIDDIAYKKMYSSNEEYPVNWSFEYFIRENDDKKIWFRRFTEDNENLLYDFSINVGDSVIVGHSLDEYLYVDSITTVAINEVPRNKYWMSSNYDYYSETWIEGIGSNKGIVWSGSMTIVGGWIWLLCVSDEGELLYMNPNFESCYMIPTGIAEQQKDSFRLIQILLIRH